MKRLIKKLLRENILNEVMTSTTGNEPHENGNANYFVIAQDNESNDFLLLIVELEPENNEFIYSYSFQVLNQNAEIVTNRMYTRGETAKYLPMEIKSTVIPLVKQMTINLVNRIKPNIIRREATEFLTQNGMKRYDEISKLLQDELGYTLIEQGKNAEGKQLWKFKKGGVERELNEDNILAVYQFESSDTGKTLKKAEKVFCENLKSVWFEHRRIDEERRLTREKK
jgi:hypothetical protein